MIQAFKGGFIPLKVAKVAKVASPKVAKKIQPCKVARLKVGVIQEVPHISLR